MDRMGAVRDGGGEVAERWLRVLRRRWRAGALLCALLVALAVGVVFIPRPIWRAEASLRLGAPAPVGGLSLGGGNAGPAGLFTLFQQITGDPFANELELLSSRTVVEGVVLDNALGVKLRAPRGWYRDSLLTRLSETTATRKATFRASWLPDGRIRLRQLSPTDSAIGDVAPGTPASFGGLVVAFQPRRPRMPRVVRLATIPFGDAVRRAGPRIHAERQRREANLVRVRFDDPDPGLALGVVASATSRYTALRAALQRRESAQTTDSLETLARQTLSELRTQEDSLERFQRSQRVIAPEAQAEAVVKREAEVATALDKARSELARVDDVVQRVNTAPPGGDAWAGLVAHPTFLENRTLGDLLTTLVHLQEQRIDLATRRTPEDRGMRALDDQIRYLDGSLRSLVRQYREGVAHEVALLEAQQAALNAVVARTPAAEVELGRRQRALKQLSEVYLFTDQRLRQESLKDAVSYGSVQLVDPPEILFKPVWPRKLLGLGAGLLLAIAGALLGMALAERADGSVRTAADVYALVGAPVLATPFGPPAGGLILRDAERRALLRNSGGLLLTAIDAPQDAAAVAAVLAGGMEERSGNGSAARADEQRTFAGAIATYGATRNGGNGASARSPLADGAPTPGPLATAERAATADRPGPSFPTKEDPLPRVASVAVAPLVDGFAAATLVAETAPAGTAIVLVLRQGSTRRADTARVVELLRAAGAQPAGVIVLSSDERAAGELWS